MWAQIYTPVTVIRLSLMRVSDLRDALVLLAIYYNKELRVLDLGDALVLLAIYYNKELNFVIT